MGELLPEERARMNNLAETLAYWVNQHTLRQHPTLRTTHPSEALSPNERLEIALTNLRISHIIEAARSSKSSPEQATEE